MPPSAVRQKLIQIGRIAEAAKDGNWSKKRWKFKSRDGGNQSITGLGYIDPAWDEVHEILVRDRLKQAIGRARSVTNKAIEVAVFSDEYLDIPISDESIVEIKDAESDTFEACLKFANSEGPIPISEVAQHRNLTKRQVREHLNQLELAALVTKIGQRGGWRIAPSISVTREC